MSHEMFFAIDRFEEGDWVVLEDDQTRTFSIPRQWLPSEARPGDIVKVVQEREPQLQLLRIELDAGTRAERLGQALKLRSEIPSGPKGDVSI
jgi:hypothetical protein